MEHAEVLTDSLARTIARHRKRRGWTMEELAVRAGLHRTYIGLVERGQRGLSIHAAARIATAFDCRLSQLLAEAEEDAAAPSPLGSSDEHDGRQ